MIDVNLLENHLDLFQNNFLLYKYYRLKKTTGEISYTNTYVVNPSSISKIITTIEYRPSQNVKRDTQTIAINLVSLQNMMNLCEHTVSVIFLIT